MGLLPAPPLIRICTHTFLNSKTAPINTQKVTMHYLKLTHLSFTLLRIHSVTFHFFACMIPLKLKCQLYVVYNCCMLFFNTEFGIYLNSQSPGFKPGTVSQIPGFNPGTILKAQALNLTLFLKAQALKLALLLKPRL